MLKTFFCALAIVAALWTPASAASDMSFLRKMGLPVDQVPAEVTEECFNLTTEQFQRLVAPAGPLFVNDQEVTDLLCLRPTDGGQTLAVYDQYGGERYHMIFITYDARGRICDAMCAYEWSDEWELNPGTGDGIMRALNQELNFTSLSRFTVNCSLRQYVKGHYDEPSWNVRWHQSYTIDENGRFVLTDVAEDERMTAEESEGTPPYDEVVLTHMRVFTMCLVSQRDDSALTAWEAFLPQAEQAYGGRQAFEAGGIASSVGLTHLYHLNPQRLLQWVGAHHGPNDRLAAYFAGCEDLIEGDVVRREVAKMKDAAARKYVGDIVKYWE
ncbi:MAG: hypothetical protein IJ632_05005 [Muribaculaceae bacterium]|nr:hypothetical protein [Muribaculaceae bacterium]